MTTPHQTTTDAWEALHRAHVTTTRRFQNRPEFKTISYREFDVLDVLSRADNHGMRLNRLNDHVPLTQSSLSRMIERLEARGLLTRWQDPDDHRGLRIRLTDRGRALHQTVQARHREHIYELMTTALTPDEQTTLTHLTTKLRTTTPRTRHPFDGHPNAPTWTPARSSLATKLRPTVRTTP